MPNLKPPITTTPLAVDYFNRINKSLSGADFCPLMTLYLTDNTSAEEIQKAYDSKIVKAIKYYPAGATTNSESGVTRMSHVTAALSKMQTLGMPLLIHGEVTDPQYDIFDREKIFINQQLKPLITQFPNLKIVLEHVTSQYGIEFVSHASENIAATITAHHLLANRNHMLAGGIRPHYYCLPILKRETDRKALLKAATSGNPKIFLGTDSAPHQKSTKESACGCAGCYTAHAAIELYAEAFESVNALDKLEAFASLNGPAFYGLPINQKQITLVKRPWKVPPSYPFGTHHVIPFRANETITWQLQ